MITGPQSPSVLSNMVVSIEQRIDWITNCVRHMRWQQCPGKLRRNYPYLGGVAGYRARGEQVAASHYEGFQTSLHAAAVVRGR